MQSKLFKGALALAALGAMSTGALAAGTNTGVEAGFSSIATDLETVLNGAGGYLILIISVIVGAVVLAATSRWTSVIMAVGVALVLGYGVSTISSLGGISASTDLLAFEVTADPHLR